MTTEAERYKSVSCDSFFGFHQSFHIRKNSMYVEKTFRNIDFK